MRLRADSDYFRAAAGYTAQRTSFAARLVEKDYLCTVLLEYLTAVCPELVFKGGTCLAKVHANFYRMSEDLDFVIPMPVDTPRSQRSKRAAALKVAIADLPERLPIFRIVEPLAGASNSTQYNAVIGYTPLTSLDDDTIKIEVGLREPLILSVLDGPANTILLDPNSDRPLVSPLTVRCIAKTEAFAEKFRAALSRRVVAARDFFDLDYAVRKMGLRTNDAELISLVRQKLSVRGNDPVDVSERRLTELRQQVGPQLQPVLRSKDFSEFDVDRAFSLVAAMSAQAF